MLCYHWNEQRREEWKAINQEHGDANNESKILFHAGEVISDQRIREEKEIGCVVLWFLRRRNRSPCSKKTDATATATAIAIVTALLLYGHGHVRIQNPRAPSKIKR